MYGYRIRSLRKERNLTMKDLGNKLGLAESTISGYENETREPDYETFQKIADFFDVTSDYLLGRSDDPLGATQSGNEEYNVFFKNWEGLSDEDRQKALEYIELLKLKAKEHNKD